MLGTFSECITLIRSLCHMQSRGLEKGFLLKVGKEGGVRKHPFMFLKVCKKEKIPRPKKNSN